MPFAQRRISMPATKWPVSLTLAALAGFVLAQGARGADDPQTPTPQPGAKTVDQPSTKSTAKPAKSPRRKRSRPAGEVRPVPLGLSSVPVPADNPTTNEKIELGRMLYFDKRVSKDGTISCATCHDPKEGWAEHEPTSTGIHGQKGGRNSPTVINAAYATSQFWDGRAASLEEQAVGPVANSIEMGSSMDAVVERFSKIPGYQERFQKVFGTGVTEKGFAQAIAAFERTILSGDSPYDQFKAGKQNAMTDAQQRGLKTFQKAGCANCHAPPLFSSYEFHNAGAGADKPKPDEGRKAVTKKDEDTGAFRVPSLREVANTAPYFHDGSAATLEQAVALMAAGGKDNPHRASDFDAVRDAKLSAQDQKDLVEFLKALSGKYPIVEPPKLPE
jgi:cytochrome c peroxidase